MSQLQAIEQAEERKSRRIRHLQKIVASGTSLIQRAQAKFELAQIQTNNKSLHRNTIDTTSDDVSVISAAESPRPGTVRRNSEMVELDIRRERERAMHEEEIRRIQQELKEEAALKSVQRRQSLQAHLAAAEADLEAWVMKVEASDDHSHHSSEEEDDGEDNEEEEQEEEQVEQEIKGRGVKWAEDTLPEKKNSDEGTLTTTEGSTNGDTSTSTPNIADDERSLFTYHGKGYFLEAVHEDEPSIFSYYPNPSETPTKPSRLQEIAMLKEVATTTTEQTTTATSSSSGGSGGALPEVSQEEIMNIMDEEHNENAQRDKELIDSVGVLFDRSVDKDALISHWEYKTTRLTNKCLMLEGKDNKDKQEKQIKELEAWKQIQEERIESMQNPAAQPLSKEGTRVFSLRVSYDPSFRLTLERAVSTSKNMNKQIRNEAKLEMMALDEALALTDTDKTELKKDMVMMKLILHNTYKKRKGVIYQLSCRKCTNHMKFVGMTNERALDITMRAHYDQVVKEVKKSKNSRKGRLAGRSGKEKESWAAKFAEHFARHCKPSPFNLMYRIKSVPEERVIEFCQKNVKVEVLRRERGSRLYWEEREINYDEEHEN